MFRLEIDILVDIWTCLVGRMERYEDENDKMKKFESRKQEGN